ncbi:MAG: hypothetical protein GQ574_06990 [Crocinitomix sp.]|nr:hypothetical protein [Crocinitomix sp.]
MNGAHFHLIVNHLPIVGVIIGTLVMITGFLLRKNQIKQTALGINIFSAITGVAAFLTGEAGEEVVEDLSGISETLIHIHEEYAETFLILSIILGVVSIITLFLSIKNHKLTKYGFLAALLLSISLIVVGKVTGTSGGEISHPEIRSDYIHVTELESDDD